MSTPHASSRSRLPKWATSFGNQIIASLILGIVLGALALALGGDAKSNPNWLMVTLDTIGSSYVTLLKAAVVPLIFTAVVASISNLSQVTNAARLAVNTLIWFAITAFFAVLIGIAMGLIVQPGVGAQVQGKAYTGSTGSWTAFLTGLIPVNFLGLGVSAKSGDSGITASASFNVLQILVISGAVGIAALKVGEAAKPFIDVVKSALAIIQKILWWIIRLAPLGTVGLPLDGVGLLLAIDPIVDMGRTALNVAGQALVPAIVARREGILDEELYNAPRSEGGFVAQEFYDERIADEAQRLHEVEDNTAAAHR